MYVHLWRPALPVKPVPASEPRSPVYDCLCFQTRLAARRMTAFYEARLAPHGLNINQFGILAQAAATPDASMAEMAEAMALDPSTLSRTLRPLEAESLVVTKPDRDNLRLRRVTLTRAGRERLKAAARAWARAQKDAAAVMPAGAVQSVLAASERLKA